MEGTKSKENITGVEITVKVDGRQESVPLQELFNNYSVMRDYDRKFSQLSEERKGLDHMKRVEEGTKSKENITGVEMGKATALSRRLAILANDYVKVHKLDWETSFLAMTLFVGDMIDGAPDEIQKELEPFIDHLKHMSAVMISQVADLKASGHYEQQV
jgi:hypothetical protein